MSPEWRDGVSNCGLWAENGFLVFKVLFKKRRARGRPSTRPVSPAACLLTHPDPGLLVWLRWWNETLFWMRCIHKIKTFCDLFWQIRYYLTILDSQDLGKPFFVNCCMCSCIKGTCFWYICKLWLLTLSRIQWLWTRWSPQAHAGCEAGSWLCLRTGALHLGLGWGAVAPQQREVTAEGVGSRPWMRGGSMAFWTFVPKSCMDSLRFYRSDFMSYWSPFLKSHFTLKI